MEDQHTLRMLLQGMDNTDDRMSEAHITRSGGHERLEDPVTVYQPTVDGSDIRHGLGAVLSAIEEQHLDHIHPDKPTYMNPHTTPRFPILEFGRLCTGEPLDMSSSALNFFCVP